MQQGAQTYIWLQQGRIDHYIIILNITTTGSTNMFLAAAIKEIWSLVLSLLEMKNLVLIKADKLKTISSL